MLNKSITCYAVVGLFLLLGCCSEAAVVVARRRRGLGPGSSQGPRAGGGGGWACLHLADLLCEPKTSHVDIKLGPGSLCPPPHPLGEKLSVQDIVVMRDSG